MLYSLQHVFQSGLSTVMSLLDIHNQIMKAIDTKTICVGIFIDLSKAFDTVDHRILLKSWKIMGSGKLLSLGLEITYPLPTSS